MALVNKAAPDGPAESRADYVYDPHVHTAETSACGHVPARDMVRHYQRAGFAGLVVTDHLSTATIAHVGGRSWIEIVDRFLGGFHEARDEGLKLGFDVFWGAEISFTQDPGSDYLVYGLAEGFLKDCPDLLSMGLRRFRSLIDASEALIFQAHPFRPGSRRARPALLDGIEVHNGNPRHNSHNDRARAFAERHATACIAGSDAHKLEDVARAGVVLPARVADNRELVHRLKAVSAHDLYIDGQSTHGAVAE